MKRIAPGLLALVVASCLDDYPDNPPPGTCSPGERVCYLEPVSGRDYALRCNAGEVQGAIWIVDEVCIDGAVCDAGACVPP